MPAVHVNVNRLDFAIGFWRTSIRHPVNLFLFGALGLVLAIGQVGRGHEKTALAIGLALFAGLLTATLLLLFSVAITTAAMVAFSRGERGVLGEHTFRFVTDGLIESTSVNETLMKWGGVRSVRRTRHYIYVRPTRATAHIIPRRCFADVSADDDFWNALQALVAEKNS